MTLKDILDGDTIAFSEDDQVLELVQRARWLGAKGMLLEVALALDFSLDGLARLIDADDVLYRLDLHTKG
jgi:hypothetical protein